MIFEFYWNWYEDYYPWLFEHGSKTKEEYADDCVKIMMEVFDEYMNSLDSWAGVNDWMEYSLPTFEKYGYRRIKPIRWGLWGGYIVRHEHDKEDLKNFPQFVFDRMNSYNEKFEKDLQSNPPPIRS